MIEDDARQRMRALAFPYLDSGDPTGWFEPLYARSEGDPAGIPWADMQPTPGVVQWFEREKRQGEGRRALVVGCGLGDDAHFLHERGYEVTAFDIAPSAVAWCRRRYAGLPITFDTGDLFQPYRGWLGAFDFILEVNTLQALPRAARGSAVPVLAALLAPGGHLLVVARGRDVTDPPGELPWPLTRDELEPLAAAGLTEERFEDYLDQEEPPVRRFRACYRRKE